MGPVHERLIHRPVVTRTRCPPVVLAVEAHDECRREAEGGGGGGGRRGIWGRRGRWNGSRGPLGGGLLRAGLVQDILQLHYLPQQLGPDVSMHQMQRFDIRSLLRKSS
jgi:hypothetical protein